MEKISLFVEDEKLIDTSKVAGLITSLMTELKTAKSKQYKKLRKVLSALSFNLELIGEEVSD